MANEDLPSVLKPHLTHHETIERLTVIVPIELREDAIHLLYEAGWRITDANSPIDKKADVLALDISKCRIIAERPVKRLNESKGTSRAQ